MIRRLAAAALLGSASMTVLAGVPAPGAITGYWRTNKGGAVIHITAKDDHFSGRIVWLKTNRYPPDDPLGMGGQAIVDRENPHPAKRDRPMLGLRLIKGLHYHVLDNNRARWEDGRVYDADRGQWYDCKLWLADSDHLKLHGYVGIPVLGRTTTWTRVADPRTDADSGDRQQNG